jgi:esterase/lipase
MKKYWWVLIPVLLVVIYFSGPKVETPQFDNSLPELPSGLTQIESYLQRHEAQFNLRPNNQAQIIWADSVAKTNYVFLYLPGFSASQAEGYPFHTKMAEHFGANLYLARFAGHGFKENNLEDFSAEAGWASAKEALTLASALGDTLVIMSTSTGCTYALMLAQHFPDKVFALVNLSPNIRVNSSAAFLLNNPWGLEIGRLVLGEKRKIAFDSAAYGKYWDTIYTTNAVVELQSLLETAMVVENFAEIEQPTLNTFYYKNEEEQDQVVSVEAIKWMHEKLATPDSLKVLAPLTEPKNHVLGSPIKSKNVQVVIETAQKFCENVIHLKPKAN